MSYDPKVYEKVEEIFGTRRAEVGARLEAHIRETYKIPGMKEIDAVLGATGVRVMEAIRKNDGGVSFDAVRRENEELVKKRTALLLANGYPADYCDPHYHCPRCEDTGFVLDRLCDCRKKELYKAQAELSGLGRLLEKQSFDNFDERFYKDKEKARAWKKVCLDFARNGVKKGENLLLLGATGLGKTHLSTAIAKEVLEGGRSVVYESAPDLMEDFQFERFERDRYDRSDSRTDKYFAADLLIIDDLGSEVVNKFSVASFYNLINNRLNDGRSTLISTNLSPNELADAYERRITSRILGEFRIVMLEGEDVRMQKLGMKN